MAMTSCELNWLKYLLSNLDIIHHQPMHLYCDNQEALHITANLIFHERTKHVELNYHFICEKFQSGHLTTYYIRSHL